MLSFGHRGNQDWIVENHLPSEADLAGCKNRTEKTDYSHCLFLYDEYFIKTMKNSGIHEVRDSFLRLILILLGYGIFFIFSVSLFGGAALLAASTIKPLVESMGGSSLIVGIGWIAGFLMAVAVIVAVSCFLGWVCATIEERWPNNPVRCLVDWVKDIPPTPRTSSTYDW